MIRIDDIDNSLELAAKITSYLCDLNLVTSSILHDENSDIEPEMYK